MRDLRHKAILENPGIKWTPEAIEAWEQQADRKFQANIAKNMVRLELREAWKNTNRKHLRSPKAKKRGGPKK